MADLSKSPVRRHTPLSAAHGQHAQAAVTHHWQHGDRRLNITLTRPLNTSLKARAAPLYGTCVTLMPAANDSSSIDMCAVSPALLDA